MILRVAVAKALAVLRYYNLYFVPYYCYCAIHGANKICYVIIGSRRCRTYTPPPFYYYYRSTTGYFFAGGRSLPPNHCCRWTRCRYVHFCVSRICVMYILYICHLLTFIINVFSNYVLPPQGWRWIDRRQVTWTFAYKRVVAAVLSCWVVEFPPVSQWSVLSRVA